MRAPKAIVLLIFGLLTIAQQPAPQELVTFAIQRLEQSLVVEPVVIVRHGPPAKFNIEPSLIEPISGGK